MAQVPVYEVTAAGSVIERHQIIIRCLWGREGEGCGDDGRGEGGGALLFNKAAKRVRSREK